MMTPTALAALDALDLALSEMDQQSADDLWAVLTALRGPDNNSLRLKDITTAFIRRAALPKSSASILRAIGVTVAYEGARPTPALEALMASLENEVFIGYTQVRLILDEAGGCDNAPAHFVGHLVTAFRALRSTGRMVPMAAPEPVEHSVGQVQADDDQE